MCGCVLCVCLVCCVGVLCVCGCVPRKVAGTRSRPSKSLKGGLFIVQGDFQVSTDATHTRQVTNYSIANYRSTTKSGLQAGVGGCRPVYY